MIELTHETGAWLAALKFMYTHTLHFDVGDGTGQSPPSAKKALSCFRLADYLGADCLSLACVEWMREFVSPANCCLLFASGLDMRDTFLASSIVAIATEAIGTCISYEPTRDAFWDCLARLSASHMRDLVRSHDLKVISESALLDAVIFWAERAVERDERAERAEPAGAAGASSGRTDRTTEDITSIVSLLDLQRIPNDVLAATVLEPRAVLEPTKELFAAALARNVTNAPKRPPRGRIVQGIVFARQNDHGAPFELFIGDPDGKMYRVHDSPTFTPRCSFVACNKRIVALGGDIEPDGAPRGVPTVDILDLQCVQQGGTLQPTGDAAPLGSVTKGPNMRAALLCSSFVADATRVFCCGGTDPDGRTSQSIDVLDFWGLRSDSDPSDKNKNENKVAMPARSARWSLFATMSSRRTCCASVIARGKLYVLGGIHASTRVFIDTIEAFDLATHLPCDAHSGEHGALGALAPSAARPALPKMPLPRHSHAAVSVGAYIYVLGGADYDDDRTDTVVVYDTETDTWADLPRMHHARSDFSAVEYGGCIYVCGGADADAPCERYCIETRSWSRVDLAASGDGQSHGARAHPHASFILAL